MTQKGKSMNRYGLLAQAHWKATAPERYEALENPTEFFETLGETVAAQVASTSDRLERSTPAAPEYLDRVRQLRSLQKQAEELVLAELVYSVPAEPATRSAELEDLLAQLPSPAMIEETLRRLLDEAQEEAEREGWSQPLLSEEQEEQRDRLTTLLPLVRLDREPEELSAAELNERIAALTPFLTDSASNQPSQ